MLIIFNNYKSKNLEAKKLSVYYLFRLLQRYKFKKIVYQFYSYVIF